MSPPRVAFWLAVALCAAPAAAPAQPAPPPLVPMPGSIGLYRSGADAAAALKASLAKSPNLALSPVTVTDQYTVLEVFRGGLGPPGVHPGWTELHFILEGRGVFVTGGKIVTKAEGTSVIEGGSAQRVAKGDAVVVPADTPHQYTEVDGLRAVEVRFVTSPPAAK